MMASVGSSIRGSGTSVTRTSRLPCQVSARIGYSVRRKSEAAPCPHRPAIHLVAQEKFPGRTRGQRDQDSQVMEAIS